MRRWGSSRLSLSVAMVCLCCTVAVAERVVEKHPNGTIAKAYTTDNKGRRHGEYRENFASGKPKVKARYKRDRLQGTYVAYHANGKVREEAQYRSGKLHGTRKLFDDAGEMLLEEAHLNGVLLFPRSLKALKSGLAAIEDSVVSVPQASQTVSSFTPLDFDTQIRALKLLNSYRFLCGVPSDVQLSYDYGEKTAATVRLLDHIGRLTHQPQRPTNITDELWELGRVGAARSNLHQIGKVVESVHGFMFDSDPSNINRVGHRRWCLNPSMQQTAFGQHDRWVAMWAMDSSSQQVTLPPFLAYPAPGYFSAKHMQARVAWSVDLHPQHYRVQPNCRVQVHQADRNYRRTKSVEIDHFKLCRQPRGGFATSLIFRPVAGYQTGSRYWVLITGLTDASDQPTTIEYLVEFF